MDVHPNCILAAVYRATLALSEPGKTNFPGYPHRRLRVTHPTYTSDEVLQMSHTLGTQKSQAIRASWQRNPHRSCKHPLWPRSLQDDVTGVAPAGWLPQRPPVQGARVWVFRSPPGGQEPRDARPRRPGRAPGAPGAREELPAALEEGCQAKVARET